MADAMKLYRKTALVRADQFLPSEGKIPEGVFSDGLSDPRKSHSEWCLQTLEGRHTLRNGDYICTGPNGEKWNVEQSVFEASYEPALASPPVSERERELEGALDACSAALQRLHTDIEALMADSEGVAGLHRNGEIAPWSDLQEGGSYADWLGEPLWAARNAWSDARRALTAQPAGEGK